jgi:UDP-N-acetylmuramate dehydrogenase
MEDIEKILEQEFGDRLKRNEVLRNHVSLKVGGVADYFFEAKNIEDLVQAVSVTYKYKIPYFILGGGYNIVPSDAGFPGFVIKNASSNIVFSPDFSTVIVDSGVHLGRLINMAAGRDLGGLEFLFGIPSTVGGAIYGNAGAFEYEISDFVKSVTLLMPRDGKMTVVKHDPKWMNFSYRTSKLKSDFVGDKFKPVILTATLQLVQRRKDEILRMMRENIQTKKSNQPLDEHSAGSFFKNAGFGKEMAAGYLLEQSGAKKMRAGGAEFSRKHANFLVNKKNATASDIRSLASKAKDAVSSKFNVDLQEEVEYMGKW